jgi:NAD(P)H-flavin reductase
MVKKFESNILEVENMTHDVKYFKVSAPNDFDFKAGQFIMMSLEKDGASIKRPFSIVSTPSKKDYLEFCIKIVPEGKGSEIIQNLKQDDQITLTGPLGKFTLDPTSKEVDIIFIATGTGISALKSIIEDTLEKGHKKKIILLKGFRHEEHILYDKEFKELKSKYPNLEFYNIISQPKSKDPKNLNQGHVQDFIEKLAMKNKEEHFYLCGLSKMIEDVREKLKKLGIKEEAIFYEKYD